MVSACAIGSINVADIMITGHGANKESVKKLGEKIPEIIQAITLQF